MSAPALEFPPMFKLLLEGSWQAGLLVLVVVGVQRALRDTLPPAWRYVLWWIVLGRLLNPIAPASPWSLFNLIPTPAHHGTVTGGSFSPSPGWQPILTAPPSDTPTATSAPSVVVSRTPTSGVGRGLPLMTFGGALALGWAVGATYLLGRPALRNLWFSRRTLASMRPPDPELLAMLEECRALMRLRRRVELLQGDLVPSPAVFGILRPRILLPQHLAETCSPEQLRHMFLHELAHIGRGDLLVHGLTRVLQALHWFNPVLAWGFRRLRVDRELAADALALEFAGDHANRAYGLTIVQLLQNWSDTPAQPNTVGILEDNTSLERRIRAIATYRRPSWSASFVGSLLFAALASVSWTGAQTEKPDAAPVPTQAKSQPTDQLLHVLNESMRLMEVGDLETASKKVQAAFESAPNKDRARHLLSLIREALWEVEAGKRNALGESGLRADEKAARSKAGTQGDFVSRPKATSKERQHIQSLLESIRIPEVGFDNLPLQEVVRQLKALAQAHDPDGKGLNFFINPYLQPAPSQDSNAVIGPSTGVGGQPTQPETIPLGEVIVRIQPPLRDVRLVDVLRAVTSSASRPMVFIVEEYAVVFAYKPPHAPLVTRLFETSPERLAKMLESAAVLLHGTNNFVNLHTPDESLPIQEKIRWLFRGLKLNLVPPEAAFYNEVTGLLMVRASLDEMEKVEAVLEALTAQPDGSSSGSGGPPALRDQTESGSSR